MYHQQNDEETAGFIEEKTGFGIFDLCSYFLISSFFL